MPAIRYLPFHEIPADAFLPLMNRPSTRKHLIEHAVFDATSIRRWVEEKQAVDRAPGCRVRAVEVAGELAGWCGIQDQAGEFEIAIVLDSAYWGIGQSVFRDVMAWGRELGHARLFIQLLDTRRPYRFLRKMATRVCESEWQGRRFTRYELPVPGPSSW